MAPRLPLVDLNGSNDEMGVYLEINDFTMMVDVKNISTWKTYSHNADLSKPELSWNSFDAVQGFSF